MMLVHSSDSHGYRLLTVGQDIFTAEHAEEIISLVRENLGRGVVRIALMLSPAVYPYSRIISLLVKCKQQIEEKGGSFVVVQSGTVFHEVFGKLNLGAVIRIVFSENELEL